MNYCIDAETFLNIWLKYYPPDIFMGVWKGLENLVASGELGTVEPVLEELLEKSPPIHSWVKKRIKMIHPVSYEINEILSEFNKKHSKLINDLNKTSRSLLFALAFAKINDLKIISLHEHNSKLLEFCSIENLELISVSQLSREQAWAFRMLNFW